MKCDMHHIPVGSLSGVVLMVKTHFVSYCTNQGLISLRTEVTQICPLLVLYFDLSNPTLGSFWFVSFEETSPLETYIGDLVDHAHFQQDIKNPSDHSTKGGMRSVLFLRS